MRVPLLALALGTMAALAGCSAPGTTQQQTSTATTSSPATGTNTADVTPGASSFPIALREFAMVPPTVDLGSISTARALAVNSGSAVASATIEFVREGAVVGSTKITLQPGESTLVARSITATRGGTFPITARVVESGLSVSGPLTVRAPSLAEGKVEPLAITQCDRVTYRVSFKNIGDGSATALQLEGRLLDANDALVDKVLATAPDVAAGASTLVEMTHQAPALCSATSHQYHVEVVVTDQAGPALDVASAPFTA